MAFKKGGGKTSPSGYKPPTRVLSSGLTRGQQASADRYTGLGNALKQKLNPDGTPYLSADGKTWNGALTVLPPAPSVNKLPPAGPSPAESIARQQADAAAAALAKANSDGKASTRRQNENTRSLVDQQYGLLSGFDKAREIKLGNIAQALADAEKMLLGSYGTAKDGLLGVITDNDKAEADNSFRNVANAARESGDLAGEAAALGAGETDLLRAQVTALRNFAANQGDVNRSFFDTLRSANNSIGSLNSDTATGRSNLYNQAESDRESSWANYYNQVTDTYTQIANIENSNTNITTDSSEGYQKKYADAGAKAAETAAKSYARVSTPGLEKWDGQVSKQDRELNSNKASVITLGAPKKRPEGATLRKW